MLSMGLGSQMGTWVAWEGDADAMSGGGEKERERETGWGGGAEQRRRIEGDEDELEGVLRVDGEETSRLVGLGVRIEDRLDGFSSRVGMNQRTNRGREGRREGRARAMYSDLSQHVWTLMYSVVCQSRVPVSQSVDRSQS